MKLKITTLLAIASMCMSQIKADVVVIISGGGTKQKFYYIEKSEHKIICRGVGSNMCPVGWQVFNEKNVSYPLPEIIDFASKQINAGETSGNKLYKNALPVRWREIDEGLQLEIKADKLTELEHD